MLALLVPGLFGATGCAPADPGECDPTDLQHVYYDVDGYPSYAGQALVETTCAGGVCHDSFLERDQWHGVPGGFEFNVGIAIGETPADQPAELERLRRARRLVWNWRAEVWDSVATGSMPRRLFDPVTGEHLAQYAVEPLEWRDAAGRPLPGLSTAEGKELLRNWLACGAPVVEGIEGPASGDVGDIVPRALPAVSCDTGFTACGAACVDVATDHANCGACGVACGPAQACDAGGCVCSPGLSVCGAECADLATDAVNCGSCGTACGALFCASGACIDTCPAGTTDCAGSCVDQATSAANCGGCGNVCGVGQACVGGACGCAAGFSSCAGSCVELATNAANCGSCGSACPAGASCAGGVCACAGGQALCGSACVDVSSDAANCGGCGIACPVGQACMAGGCVACGASVTLASIQASTFTPACATMGCHTGARPQAGLNLTAGSSWAALVNRPSTAAACSARIRVVPGAPSRSYLVDKLRGLPAICGSQMPKAGVAVPAAQLAAIEAWICNGALND